MCGLLWCWCVVMEMMLLRCWLLLVLYYGSRSCKLSSQMLNQNHTQASKVRCTGYRTTAFSGWFCQFSAEIDPFRCTRLRTLYQLLRSRLLLKSIDRAIDFVQLGSPPHTWKIQLTDNSNLHLLEISKFLGNASRILRDTPDGVWVERYWVLEDARISSQKVALSSTSQCWKWCCRKDQQSRLLTHSSTSLCAVEW